MPSTMRQEITNAPWAENPEKQSREDYVSMVKNHPLPPTFQPSRYESQKEL